MKGEIKMNVQELMDKRAKLWEEAKNFLDTHEDKDGKLSAEDAATYEKMESDIVDIGKAIDRHERRSAMDAQMSKPTAAPIVNQPSGSADATPKGRASAEYRKDMLKALRSGFKKIGNYLSEGIDTDGGYLVPEEYDTRLIDGLSQENIMRQLGTTITTSGERKINIAGTKPAAAWISEGASLVFDDATFAQKVIDAHKLEVGVKVTNELLYDNAFDLESYIIDAFVRAISNAEEDAFLNGTGTGTPTGIFDATGGGEVAVTLSAALKADDILDLVYSLKRPYRKNAAFIMHDQTIAMIRKFKDNTSNYIWQPSYQAGEPDRLCGYPLYTSAYAPQKTAGDSTVDPVIPPTPLKIAFGDFSYYNIGDRGTRTMNILRELFMSNDMTGYVMIERVDGKLVLPEAVKILTE